MITQITTSHEILNVDSFYEEADNIECEIDRQLMEIGYVTYRLITYDFSFDEKNVYCQWAVKKLINK